MPRLDAELVRASERWRASIPQEVREKVELNLRLLNRRGIVTVGDLLAQLLELPPARQDFARWLFSSLQVRQARPVLLQQVLASRPRNSLSWGVCLGCLPPWGPATPPLWRLAGES
ncbi:MAG TPA: hypothetical protein VHB77_10850 [Planctomycetaceae bacterium]|nr:hypothetical protein [Planctomycetaceae bacterium]